MRTPRSIKRYFAFAISAVMVWVVVLAPYSGEVKAQTGYPANLIASPEMSEVGSYVYLTANSLEPNKLHYVSYLHNREWLNGMCPLETFYSDANGRWTKLIGPLTPSDVGDWAACITTNSYCGYGCSAFAQWQVTPVRYQLTVSKTEIEPGAGPTSFVISGAPPNSAIDWTTYKDGKKIEDSVITGERTDANGMFTKYNDPNSPLAWDALSPSLGHVVGHADGDSWLASPGQDPAGFMQYGPYTTQVPAGKHTAVWNLMIDNNDADNAVVAQLDVFDYTTQTQLAHRDVLRKQWALPNQYEPFLLPFETDASQAGHQIECRLYWQGSSYMRELNVSVDPAWGRYGPGRYMKVAHVYDPSHYYAVHFRSTASFTVLARPKFHFTVSPGKVPMNGYALYEITGAPPNKTITWERFLNGRLWDQGPIGTTDANGNWSFNNGPWNNDEWKGFWIYRMTIDGVTVQNQFVVGNLVESPPPDSIVIAATDLAYDPGSGKYYTDVQAHTGGPDPTTEPIIDLSSRAWFNDSQGAQPAGIDFGSINSFTGLIKSGNICSQETQNPPTDPACNKCARGLADDYLFALNVDEFLISVSLGLAIIGCIEVGLAIPVIGQGAMILCVYLSIAFAIGEMAKAEHEYKLNMCKIPGTCSLNTQKNCSKVLDGLPRAKELCKDIVQ